MTYGHILHTVGQLDEAVEAYRMHSPEFRGRRSLLEPGQPGYYGGSLLNRGMYLIVCLWLVCLALSFLATRTMLPDVAIDVHKTEGQISRCCIEQH